MRLLCILSVVVLVISITGCQTGPSETDKQIMKSLKEINQKLFFISKQIKEIQKDVEDTDIPLLVSQPYNTHNGPNMRRLKKIKLAKNASRKEVRDYIQKIINASQGQNTFSTEHIQVSMLRQVGSKNVDLLIDYAQNYYVQYALPSLVTEKNKKQILKALTVYPELITCVEKMGWGKDAKKTIFERLKQRNPGYLPCQWIDIAVQLASPKEYDALENYFINGNNPDMTYKALNQLEDFDIKKAVDKAWEYQKNAGEIWTRSQMAMIAAKYGHKDALKYLIYDCRIENNPHIASQIKASLYQLTGKTLSPKKMFKWYKENEAKLVFDPENEEYIIKSK